MIRHAWTAMAVGAVGVLASAARGQLVFDNEVGNSTWFGSASFFVPPDSCFAYNNWNTGVFACGPDQHLPTPGTDVVIGQYILVDSFGDCRDLLATGALRNESVVTATGTATYQGPVTGWGYFRGTGTHVFEGPVTPDTGTQMMSFDETTALIQGGMTIAPGASIGVYAVLKNASTMTWNGNGRLLVDGAYHVASGRIKNLPGGLFLATGDGEIHGIIGLGYIDNEGTFRKEGGLGVTQIAAAFTNGPTGVIDVRTGTLRLIQDQFQSFNGSATIALDAVLELTAVLNVTQGFTSSGLGELVMTGGGFHVDAGATATVPVLRMNNGRKRGPGTLSLTGVALLHGEVEGGGIVIEHGATATLGPYLQLEEAGTALSNHGRLLLNGLIAIAGGGIVVNEPDGVIEASGGSVDGYGFTTGPFYNRGLLRQVGPADSILSGISRNDGGTMTVEAGLLKVAYLHQTAGVTVLAGGTLWTDDSPSAMVMDGGRLTGSGLFKGHLKNLGGSFEPGHSPGTIRFDENFYQNSYTQGPGGSMVIEIGGAAAGTEHDQVIVNGLATLDGALQVTLINGFVPTAGQSFTILAASARAGMFATTDLPSGMEVEYTPTSVIVKKSASAACNIADIVGAAGTPPPDGRLGGEDFLSFMGAFAGGGLLADVVGAAGVPPPDGHLGGEDFLQYLAAFAGGC